MRNNHQVQNYDYKTKYLSNVIIELITDGSFLHELLFLRIRILTIPNCGIMISSWWNHQYCVNCFNIQCRSLLHHYIKQLLFSQTFISKLFQSILCWNSSLVMLRIRLIPIIVCLYKIPCCVSELICCMNFVTVSFNNDSLVSFNSRNNKVNRSCNFSIFKSFNSFCISGLLVDYISQKPACRNIILNQNADKIILKVSLSSSVDLNWKGSRFVGS